MFIKYFLQNSNINLIVKSLRSAGGCGPGKPKWHEKEGTTTDCDYFASRRAAPSWKKMTTFTLIMILQFEDESNEELLKSVNQTKI